MGRHFLSTLLRSVLPSHYTGVFGNLGHMAGTVLTWVFAVLVVWPDILLKEWTAPALPPGDLRSCNDRYKQGHMAVKACNNCGQTVHLACDCPNEPNCNLCNVARVCPKGNVMGEYGGGVGRSGGGCRGIICRNCQQVGHMSRDCPSSMIIGNNYGGRGHIVSD